jgi:hypothetical protein
MRRIGSRLLGASLEVGKSWDSDIKRAQKSGRCSQVLARPLESTSKRFQAKIRAEITRGLLKSTKICDGTCVVRSFSREVRKIKGMIDQYAKAATGLARDVVNCSQVNGNRDNTGPRTEQRLRDIVADIAGLDTNCRICKVAALSE